ncbi:hypothetical protein SAM40697_5240 [Streptomyces ambofaciens]|uniref:AAA domain-containing protein n=1 Tax=Streptomyces ambofaciens TaxID=1889 RepID=A0ABN4PD50_STRAM|nr:FxSxx-COOH system tetratricopeptide repeat protein [Streptomyces ambofaciens]ANB09196.1 hypothetical protein SAM40697_5240 [Streptomyces ambofaciens]
MSSAEPSGSPHDRNRATIVTFYSYKGGVGRTMAMANVAWVLADNGHRVLVVDWDLESPGLHRFLRPFLRDPELSGSTGVVDMILEYGRAVEAAAPGGFLAAGPTARLDELLERHTQMGNHADTLTYRFARPEGRVDFLGPGRQDSRYSREVATFDWARFYQEQHGRLFTRALRQSLRGDDYDYVLIDSRTGHSDNASLCTLVLPDVVVVGFNLSNQSIEGSAAVARQVREQSEGRIRVLPVPMRVEESDRERAEYRRLRARDQFGGAAGPFLPGTEERYWREVEVRHLPNVAYEEILLPFALENHEPSLQKQAYERLAAEISGDAELRFAPVRPEDRSRYARQYAEVPAPRRTVHVVHAPRDRAWADWVRAELTANGVACNYDLPAGPDAPGDVLVLMSASMVSSDLLTELARLRRMPKQGGLTEQPRIDVAWLEDVEVQPPFRDRPGPKLYTLGEEAARGALLAHFLPESRPPATWPDRGGRGPRFPGRLPQWWHVPPKRSVTFLGREEYLRELRNYLAPGRAAQPVVLHGPSGVGKRSYALEYLYRFAADYDAVWWMPAGSAASVERELVGLSERLGAARRNSPRAVDALRDMLEGDDGPRRLLLVYDDAPHPDDVESLLINSPRVHVLITSESPDWGSLARRIEVEPPSPARAVRYLLRKTEDLSPDLAERLVGLVEPLPQLLDQMAAYLNSTGRPVAESVEELTQGIGNRLADGLSSPLAVWQTVVEDLGKEQPVAVRLLGLMTRLSQDGVGWGFLESPAVLSLLGLPASEEGTRQLGFAVRALTTRSQAHRSQNGKRLRAARIILAARRQDLTPQEEQEVTAGVRRALAAYSPPDEHVDDQTMDARYAELDAHVDPSGAAGDDDPEVRRWLVNQVRYRRRSQRLRSAFELASALETAWTARSAGADSKARLLLLRLRVELANIHTDAGRFAEANRINAAALVELRAVDGLDGTFTLRSALGRGGELRALGRPQEAVAEDFSTREVLNAKSGPDHHFTLMASSNFGLSLAMVGLTADSLEMHKEVYDRRMRVLGERHSLTLRTSVHVGARLRESGQLAVSLARLQEVYRLTGEEEGGLGWSDVTALRASAALASTLRHLAVLEPGQVPETARGRLDSARKCDLRAGEGFTAYGGEAHPEALAARVGLAADLRLLGRTREATELAEQNLAAYRAWDEDHLFARICEVNLALCLRDAEPETAVELSERGLRGLRALLDVDPHHPYVLTASLNHASMLVFAGDSEAARRLDERTHEGLLQKYGADHPLVRTVASHLGLHPADTGRPGPEQRIGIELDIPSI